MIILTIINIFFPIIGLLSFLIIYMYKYNKKYYLNVIEYNIFYSISIMSYFYDDLKRSGDITRYILANKNYDIFITITQMLANKNYLITYTWSICNYIINKLHMNFKILSFLAIFIILISNYNIIVLSTKNIFLRKNILIKFLIFFSFPILFSTYRNLLSFSLIALGIFKNMKENKGKLLIFLGMGIHLSSIPIVLLYLISKKIKFRCIYVKIVLFITILLRVNLFENFLNMETRNVFFKKLKYYVFGKWSVYTIHSNGDYLTYYLLVVMLFILILSINTVYKNRENIKNGFFEKYNNFIFFYLTIFILILPYRTIAIRIFLTGFPFFVPLFIQKLLIGKQEKIFKFIFYFLLSDIRWFFILYLDYFQIGKGFPYNIFTTFFIK